MARLRILGLASVFAGLLGVTAGPASAGSERHPLFNDQGTLTWYTSLDEAQAVARATGKLIFIESGRRACGNCRHVVEQVLPASNVRQRIASIAIGLADDCDESEPRVVAMLNAGVPDATVLPLCGFVTPELRWVTGFSGYMDPGSFSGHLSRAEDRFEQVQRFRKSKSAPAAPVCPAPAPAPAPARAPAPVPVPVPVVVARPCPPPASKPAAPPPTLAPLFPRPLLDDGACPGGVCHVPPRPRPAAAKPVPTVVPAPPQPLATRPSITPDPLPALAAPPATPPAPQPIVIATVAKASPVLPASPIFPAPTVVPAPQRPVTTIHVNPIVRARHAAAEGRWGEVLKVNDDSRGLTSAERSELDALVRRANDWVLGSFELVLRSAKARQYPDARRTLSVLSQQLDGTTCPGLIDAERGSRAVERLSAIEQGAPDQVDAPEQLRKTAYAEFRGTRWAPLFKGRGAAK